MLKSASVRLLVALSAIVNELASKSVMVVPATMSPALLECWTRVIPVYSRLSLLGENVRAVTTALPRVVLQLKWNATLDETSWWMLPSVLKSASLLVFWKRNWFRLVLTAPGYQLTELMIPPRLYLPSPQVWARLIQTISSPWMYMNSVSVAPARPDW